MALQLPSYNSQYSTTPVSGAYAWLSYMSIDFKSGVGRIVVDINQDTASANALMKPIDQKSIEFGYTFPNVAQFMVDNSGAWSTVRSYLYGKLQNHPFFLGSTQVP